MEKVTKKTILKKIVFKSEKFDTWTGNDERQEMIIRISEYTDRNEKAFAYSGTKCYGNGYIHETVCTPTESKKSHIGRQGQADLQLRIDGVQKPLCGFNSRIECKFGGADISDEMQYFLENGKTKSNFVIYGSNNYYGYENGDFLAPVIIETEVFLRFLLDSKCVRFHKSNGKIRGGEKFAAIQVNKKAIQVLLENATLYSPCHKYSLDEINGKTEWKPTKADFDFWKRYTALFTK